MLIFANKLSSNREIKEGNNLGLLHAGNEIGGKIFSNPRTNLLRSTHKYGEIEGEKYSRMLFKHVKPSRKTP